VSTRDVLALASADASSLLALSRWLVRAFSPPKLFDGPVSLAVQGPTCSRLSRIRSFRTYKLPSLCWIGLAQLGEMTVSISTHHPSPRIG
jgi:hypothetical protein